MIEVEVQNETHQTQERLRFASVPRIGEGLRLREPDGLWASYDVLDVWYQRAEYGDIWMPFLHVCMTPADADAQDLPGRCNDMAGDLATAGEASESDAGLEEIFHNEEAFASLAGEAEPFKI